MLKSIFNKKQTAEPVRVFRPEVVETAPEMSVKDEHFYELKNQIHAKLIEEANLKVLDTLTDDELREEIQLIVEDFLRDKSTLLNDQERQSLITEVKDELTGLGPLEPLLRDHSLSDILCNTYKDVYVESGGVLKKTNARFVNDAHLMNIIDRIVSKVGRRIDESTPMVDARLPDGSRVNAIIPPLAVDGPILSIRRFGGKVLEMENLVQLGALTPDIATFLAKCVKARLNIMVSGGTGAGKTTLLNVLSRYIPENERIVTIEDSAELQLQQEHVVRLETRPANIEGTGSVTQRDLVRNSLRMRPDRIIIGEVRGTEAFDMLQAMNTGHEGSLTTIHSNSPRDSLTRLESMLLMTGVNLPEKAMRFMVSSALDLIIQVSRVTDGSRKILSVIEVVGMEGEIISLQEIFRYERQGLDPDGKVIGRFVPTGIRPRFTERLELAGISFPEDLFCTD
jgi:pilus assembly protein CpaF